MVENKTLFQEETAEEMKSKLEIERSVEGGGDIYKIARRVQILSSLGYEYCLTMEEEERLYSTFLQCREGKIFLPEWIPWAYQMARAFMLIRHFFPLINATPSEEEVKEFIKAAKMLADKEEFFQLSSLLETCTSFNVDASGALSPEQTEKVANEMAVSS